MNCKFIWWNLPLKIKEKLNITLTSNWLKIPTEMNKVLDELKLTKPSCYSSLYPNGHNVYWFNLPYSLTNVCELIDCVEPLNRFEYKKGTAPSLQDFETAIGFTLLNGAKNEDVITFDDIGYIIDGNFNGEGDLLTIKSQAFSIRNLKYCVSLTSIRLPIVETMNDFEGCASISIFESPNVDAFSSTEGYDNVFDGIVGNTITFTTKAIHQTSNNGGLEGDLQYLADNNNVTFIWV